MDGEGLAHLHIAVGQDGALVEIDGLEPVLGERLLIFLQLGARRFLVTLVLKPRDGEAALLNPNRLEGVEGNPRWLSGDRHDFCL